MNDSDLHPDRRDPRYLASLPAVLHYECKDFPCSAQDLSRNGVLLVGEIPDPAIPDLELTIRTPQGDLELRLAGRVASSRRDESTGEAKLGLQFGELDDARVGTLEQLVSRVVEGMAPAAIETLTRDSSVREIREALEKTPTAHRIALAKRAETLKRGFLRFDTDPHVLENLVRNPNIVLPEVITIARLPHLLPGTVEIIARDPRWSNSDELKILLVTHPRVTFNTADRLVARFNDLLLQRVIHRSNLHPAVREKVMRRLARKNRA